MDEISDKDGLGAKAIKTTLVTIAHGLDVGLESPFSESKRLGLHQILP
jgi:hypothetical protein